MTFLFFDEFLSFIFVKEEMGLSSLQFSLYITFLFITFDHISNMHFSTDFLLRINKPKMNQIFLFMFKYKFTF